MGWGVKWEMGQFLLGKNVKGVQANPPWFTHLDLPQGPLLIINMFYCLLVILKHEISQHALAFSGGEILI